MINGKFLLTIRQLKGLTQEELSHLSGVPKPYISDTETGKRNLEERHIRQLEAALDVQFDHVRPAFETLVAAVSNLQPA